MEEGVRMRIKVISCVICAFMIVVTFVVAEPANFNQNTGTSSIVNYQIGFKNLYESIIWSDWASDGNIANVTGSFLRPPTTIYIKIEAPSCNIHYQVGFKNRLEDIIWSDWASNGKDANVTFDFLRPPSSWYLKVESPNFNVTYQIGFKNRLEDIIWSDWVSDGNIANATFNFLRPPIILYMKIKMLGPISAMIDIDPNTLNLKSKGKWITCYIDLPTGYDVNDIDIGTITLEDTIPAEWGDIQGDTLMVKFDRSDVEDRLSPGTYNLKVTGALTDGTEFEGYSDEIRVIDPPKEDLQIEPLQNALQMKPIQKELQDGQSQGVPHRECFQEGKHNKLSYKVLQNALSHEGRKVKLFQEPTQSEISQVSQRKESSQEKPKSGQSIEEPLSEPLQELTIPYLTVEKSVSPTHIYKQGDPGTPNNATVTMTVTGVGDPIPKEIPGPADIVFVVDATGSMLGEIDEVKNKTNYIVDSIESEILDVQFGLASYRDHVGNFSGCGYSNIYGDPGDWVFKIEQDITKNTNDFKRAVNNLYVWGGADRPEAVADAIYHTTHNFTWRGGDVAKIALLLGDGPGHDCDNFYFKWGDYDSTGPCPDGHTILDVVADSAANNVIWATIGWDDTKPNTVGWAQWNYLAEFTGGEYRYLGSEDIADVIVDLIVSVVPDFIDIAGKNAIVTEVLPPYIFLVNNTFPHWIIKPPLVYILWSAFDPLPMSFDGVNTYTWNLGTIRIGETRTIKFNIQSIEDGYGKLVDEYPDTRLEYFAWNGTDFVNSIMVPFPETLIDVLISSQWPNADAGPDSTVKEGDIVELNGSSSNSPNGTIKIFDWDFDATEGLWWETGAMPDATGPTPTHVYGDDGKFIVTLRVTDNNNLSATDTCNVTVQNVNPMVTIESVTMNLKIGLRVAGRKYNNVSMTLYEDGNPIGNVSIERMPGSPNEQMAWIPVSINFSKSYSATVTYTPEDPPNVGANPVWIYIKSQNSSIKKIHHTFNVQQSKKRDSDHWNHVEPWEVDLNTHFIGLPFEITSHITDPGSDDETLTITYGSQTVTITYLNNPPNLDPYPSPEVKPVDILDTTTLVYEGAGTLTLVVKDDDNIRLGVGQGSDSFDVG